MTSRVEITPAHLVTEAGDGGEHDGGQLVRFGLRHFGYSKDPFRRPLSSGSVVR